VAVWPRLHRRQADDGVEAIRRGEADGLSELPGDDLLSFFEEGGEELAFGDRGALRTSWE